MTARHPLRPPRGRARSRVGGAVGALLRYGLTEAFPDPADGFPWTIFAVNVVGLLRCSPLLPAFPVVRRHALLPPLLGTGVLGGFTTLSTYAEQARALVARRARRHGGRPTSSARWRPACSRWRVADRFSTAGSPRRVRARGGRPVTWLLVALGAAVGAPLRYVAGHLLDGRLPRGTILVNWVGSFLLGWFTGLGLDRARRSRCSAPASAAA